MAKIKGFIKFINEEKMYGVNSSDPWEAKYQPKNLDD